MITPQFVLTLNSHFVPQAKGDSRRFGVVGFVIDVADALAHRNQLAGFVLYRREPDRRTPEVHGTSFLGHPAVELLFHFDMPRPVLRAAFADAVHGITNMTREGADRQPLVVYHQTNTLLHITPADLPFLITHHGPFASEILRLFGPALTCRAFHGGPQKLWHLLRAQTEGLAHLRDSSHCVAVELSGVQEAVLRRHGVDASKLRRIPPPMCARTRPDDEELESLPLGVAQRPDGVRELHLVSATARIDAFKDINTLIAMANRLNAIDVPVRVSLFVGGADEGATRGALMASVASALRPRTRIVQCLPHAELLRFFRAHRSTAVFVCTSRYETFGITPFEAIVSGMSTLVPDQLDRIGVADYVDPTARVAPHEDMWIARLLTWHREQQGVWMGEWQRESILSRMGPQSAVSVLTDTAARICLSARAPGCETRSESARHLDAMGAFVED